jgi:hypothetical protein
MPATCPQCGTANPEGPHTCPSCGRAFSAGPAQGTVNSQLLHEPADRPKGQTGAAASSSDRASLHSPAMPARPRVALWWALTLLGCLALGESARLPWATSRSVGETITISGFNTVNIISGHDSIWAEIQSAGVSLPDTSSQATFNDDGSSDIIVIPGLSAIPEDLGGSDVGARWGIFVFVPAAIAFFLALWLLAGEPDRRRSMARGVLICAGLTLLPLLHDLITIQTGSSGQSLGVGIFIGLTGALATMAGSALLYWSLR